jgi:hypothetical protein
MHFHSMLVQGRDNYTVAVLADICNLQAPAEVFAHGQSGHELDQGTTCRKKKVLEAIPLKHDDGAILTSASVRSGD